MHARLDQEDWRPDIWILNAILALWMIASGRDSTSSGLLQRTFHICVLEGNPITGRTLSVIRTCCWKRPDGCKQEQFKASRHRGRFGWKVLIVRTEDALVRWVSGRYITLSGRLAGNRIFLLVNCAESSGSTLNSGIPVYNHHYKEVILSNRKCPITN
jgi:hypothetical protein